MITGKRSVIQRKHTATPIPGSKSTAKIVTFQKNSGYEVIKRARDFSLDTVHELDDFIKAYLLS